MIGKCTAIHRMSLLAVAVVALSIVLKTAAIGDAPEGGDGATSTDPQTNLDAGLVAYYPFEGNPQDASGHENHGQPEGTVEYSAGVIGKCVRFHGYDNRGYIRIRNSKSLEFEKATTFACWYRIDDEAGQDGLGYSNAKISKAHQAIVAKGSDRLGFSLLSMSQLRDEREIAVIAHNFKDKEVGLVYPPHEALGRWHHIATVADDAGVRLYHDGTLVGETHAIWNLSEVNHQDVFVGIQGPNGSQRSPAGFLWYPLNGAIDELRIYNRALPAKEIRALAISGTQHPWGPEQATGLPNTPNRTNATTAWSSQTPDAQSEWLALEYARAIRAKAILVYETSGNISSVGAFNPEGVEVKVWSGRSNPGPSMGPSKVSVLHINDPILTNRIKIYFDSPGAPQWKQVDAVGLRDESGNVQWGIKATASSTRADAAVRKAQDPFGD